MSDPSETVARKIAANLAALGANRFDLKYGMGGPAHEALMTKIELYCSWTTTSVVTMPTRRSHSGPVRPRRSRNAPRMASQIRVQATAPHSAAATGFWGLWVNGATTRSTTSARAPAEMVRR